MKEFRKALTAFGGGLAMAVGEAMKDGNLTLNEAIASVGLALTLAAAVYGIRNGDKP